jgi:hypothetical protein
VHNNPLHTEPRAARFGEIKVVRRGPVNGGVRWQRPVSTSQLTCFSCSAPLDIGGVIPPLATCPYCNATNRLDHRSPSEPVTRHQTDENPPDPDEEKQKAVRSVIDTMRQHIGQHRVGKRALKKLDRTQQESVEAEYKSLYDVMGELMMIDADDDDPGRIALEMFPHMATASRRYMTALYRYNRRTKGEEHAKHRLETVILDFETRLESSDFASWQEPEITRVLMYLRRTKNEPLPHAP